MCVNYRLESIPVEMFRMLLFAEADVCQSSKCFYRNVLQFRLHAVSLKLIVSVCGVLLWCVVVMVCHCGGVSL